MEFGFKTKRTRYQKPAGTSIGKIGNVGFSFAGVKSPKEPYSGPSHELQKETDQQNKSHCQSYDNAQGQRTSNGFSLKLKETMQPPTANQRFEQNQEISVANPGQSNDPQSARSPKSRLRMMFGGFCLKRKKRNSGQCADSQES